MPRPVLKELHKKLASVERTRIKMETMFGANQIDIEDIETVYEGLFLRVVTGFEQFCDDLFFAILKRRVRYAGGRVVLRMRADQVVLREILTHRGDEKYLDWLPFNRATERAELFLVGGKPFSDVDLGKRSIIKTITTVRHAIAHSSEHSDREFMKAVNHDPATGGLTPAQYLRSQFRHAPRQNRFQNYVGELGAIAAVMC